MTKIKLLDHLRCDNSIGVVWRQRYDAGTVPGWSQQQCGVTTSLGRVDDSTGAGWQRQRYGVMKASVGGKDGTNARWQCFWCGLTAAPVPVYNKRQWEVTMSHCRWHRWGWRRHQCRVPTAQVQGTNDTSAEYQRHRFGLLTAPVGDLTAPVQGVDGIGAAECWRHWCGLTTTLVRFTDGTGKGYRRHRWGVTTAPVRADEAQLRVGNGTGAGSVQGEDGNGAGWQRHWCHLNMKENRTNSWPPRTNSDPHWPPLTFGIHSTTAPVPTNSLKWMNIWIKLMYYNKGLTLILYS